MARTALILTILFLALMPTGALAQPELHHQERPEKSPILAFWDFEQPEPSGPDTFWIAPHSQGSVDLSAAFRVSGERSLHIREVPDDRTFAEFLGYFKELIATDPAVLLKPFVAPGRRQLFVERYRVNREPLAEDELEDLLWEARSALAKSSAEPGLDPDRLECAADEAFFQGDLDLAEQIYDRLHQDPKRAQRILLKLSDISYKRGDREEERRLRESIYGSLDYEEFSP